METPVKDALMGLTVVAQTGDGELIGVIRDVTSDAVQLQVGRYWFESVTWECLRATRSELENDPRDKES